VYLSGALLFVAGLSIVRAHNRWPRSWPVLVTLTGWFALLLGLLRMFAPALYQQGAQGHGTTLLGFEAALLGLGLFLTYRAYASAD
jgi:1,4-dihydroxy-2-naphthoate octaprenyltransferase